MMVTRIGSKRRRTISRTRPVSKLPTQIMLSITSVRLNLNAGIDCPHLVGHLPLGSRLPSEQYGSLASCMTARLRLPLLLAGVWDAFFRSVSRAHCLLDLKTRVPKLA